MRPAAIAALRALEAPAGHPSIAHSAFQQGVAAGSVAARAARFECHGVQVLVDVGHNPQAARELAAWLRRAPDQPRTQAVFAALGDKDLVGVVAALAEQVDGWWLAGLAGAGSRALSVDDLAQRLAGTAAGAGRRYATVAEALAAARAASRTGDRVLVFGSFHTAAAALQALNGECP